VADAVARRIKGVIERVGVKNQNVTVMRGMDTKLFSVEIQLAVQLSCRLEDGLGAHPC
jgi:hypothetical protein